MTAPRVVPVFDGITHRILEDIKNQRREKGNPLPAYRFAIELPMLRNPEESPLPCRETVEDFEAATANFSAQIKSLFDALSACQDLDTEDADEHSPYLQSNAFWLRIEVERHYISRQPDCHHRDYHSTRLVLKDADALPQVSCVTTLELLPANDSSTLDGVAKVRPISPRVPLELLAHLPAVQKLDCPWLGERLPITFPSEPMRQYTRPWEGPWRDARHEFGRVARELNDAIPDSLMGARLWFYKSKTARDDQSVQMPNLVHPMNTDPVSAGLRTFASHLQVLDLRSFLMPDIFDLQTPWPRMKRLRIEFHPMRPDGSWYFVGPRGEDPNPEGFHIRDEHYAPTITTEEDEMMDEKHIDWEEEHYEEDERRPDMFRTVPSPDKMEVLLTAFARKIKTTTSLEEAELFAWLNWEPCEERKSQYGDEVPCDEDEGVHRWGLKYTAAAKGNGSKASVEWQVGDWRPPGHVLAMFEDLGGGNSNGRVEFTWRAFEFVGLRDQDGFMLSLD